MATLWGDGWFYISTMGFLASSALFLYLLGLYRSAVEEADASDESPVPAPSLDAVVPLSDAFCVGKERLSSKDGELDSRQRAVPDGVGSGVAGRDGELLPSKDGGPLPTAAPAPVVTPIVAFPAEKEEEDETLVLPPRQAPASSEPVAQPAALSGEGERLPSKDGELDSRQRAVPDGVGSGVAGSDGGPLPAAATAAPAPVSSSPGYTGPDRRRGDVTPTGGISPAVVYLQNIKSQMEKFEKEISALKAIASQQAAQGEQMLKRLGDLAEAVKAGSAPTRSVELPLQAPPSQESAPTAAAPLQLRPPEAESPSSLPLPFTDHEPLPADPSVGAEQQPSRDGELDSRQRAVPDGVGSGVAGSDGERLTSKDGGPLPTVADAQPVVIEALPQTPEQAADSEKPRKGPVWPV